MTIVNAIITAGNNIAAAVSKSDSTPTTDKLKQSFDALQDLLTPHAAEARERRAQKMKEVLDNELDKGVLTFRVNREQKDRRRRKRRSR